MVRKLKEGYENEDFVAYYNGELFYTGQLNSNFRSAIQELIRKDESAHKTACDYLEYIGIDYFDCEDEADISYLLSQSMYYDAMDGEDYWNFDGFEIFPEYELNESIKRKRSMKEYIDNSDTIEFLEDIFEKLRYHSKNLNKTQYYLFSVAYDCFQEYRNGNCTEREIFKKCREFAEYCQTHNRNLTNMQDSLVDDIISNT